jgi:hypothetical protein
MKARKKFLLDEIDSKDFNEIKAECESTVKALAGIGFGFQLVDTFGKCGK